MPSSTRHGNGKKATGEMEMSHPPVLTAGVVPRLRHNILSMQGLRCGCSRGLQPLPTFSWSC